VIIIPLIALPVAVGSFDDLSVIVSACATPFTEKPLAPLAAPLSGRL
jgi:hypothetical protein